MSTIFLAFYIGLSQKENIALSSTSFASFSSRISARPLQCLPQRSKMRNCIVGRLVSIDDDQPERVTLGNIIERTGRNVCFSSTARVALSKPVDPDELLKAIQGSRKRRSPWTAPGGSREEAL